MARTSALDRLCAWYRAQCDGTWEHDCGVVIETRDNPGWRVRIDLSGTRHADREFERCEDGHEPDAWLVCEKDGRVFRGACSPERLEDVLSTFLEWAESWPLPGVE